MPHEAACRVASPLFDHPADRLTIGLSLAMRRHVIGLDGTFASLTEVLAARFPVCRAVIGEQAFRTMTALYAELCPPRSCRVSAYGDDLGDFIDFYPPARMYPYLGDIARLEAARARALHARAAIPLTAEEIASVPPCAWEHSRVVLHPSIQIVRSMYPIVSLYEAHSGAHRRALSPDAMAEDALIARPDATVEISCMPPGGAVFLSSLLAGATFREAAERSATSDPRADTVRSLASLFASRIIVGLSTTEPRGAAHPCP